MIETPSRLNRSHLETLIFAIYSPFATAKEITVLHAHKNLTRVKRALSYLERNGFVSSLSHRTPWATSNTKRFFATAYGISVMEESVGWPAGEAYVRDYLSVTRQWQRILHRRLDTVALIYDLLSRIAQLRPDQTPLRPFFLRTGAFDAVAFSSGDEGMSYGIMRKGTSLLLSDFVGRLLAVQESIGELNRYGARGLARRGPRLIFCIVKTEQERVWLVRDIRRQQRSFVRLNVVVATENDLDDWTHILGDRSTLSHIVQREHRQSNFNLIWPTSKRAHPPEHLDRLPPLYTPRQRRIMEAVYDWPLMTTEQVASFLGTPRNGPFSRDVRILCENGLLGQIQKDDWPGRHLYVPNRGLSFIAAANRADPRVLIKRHGKGGTETAQLLREAWHAFGVNAFVSQACRELPYAPQALSARAARRSYRTPRWTRDERPIWSSVSPDAAILLLGQRHPPISLLLEWENQSTRGGQRLTDKLLVWLNYYREATLEYLGLEYVLFVVPTAAAAVTLTNRMRELIVERKQTDIWEADSQIKVFVTSKVDLDAANSILLSEIWTLTTHPDAPRVALFMR